MNQLGSFVAALMACLAASACGAAEDPAIDTEAPSIEDVGTSAQAVLTAPQLLRFDGGGRDSASIVFVDGSGFTYIGGSIDDPAVGRPGLRVFGSGR